MLGDKFHHTVLKISRGRFFPAPITTLGVLGSVVVLSFFPDRWIGCIAVTFACLLYGLASESSWIQRLLSTSISILGGEISYSIYLLHRPLQLYVVGHPSFHSNNLIDFLYIPLVVFPFSWLTFKFIETPARKLLRSLFAALQLRLARPSQRAQDLA
jgi:peptidoglycan/LPS O-acetylase OafA/YrhL